MLTLGPKIHFQPSSVQLQERSIAGFALVEAMVAAMLLTLTIVVSTGAMLQTNRQAAAMRTMAAARGIVQRNVDAALTVTWNASVEPPILALTTGSVYDDDGSPGAPATPDNKVQIATAQDNASSAGPITGTLTRIVSDAAVGTATLRRVTFQLDYTYANKPYTVQMATVRAMDD